MVLESTVKLGLTEDSRTTDFRLGLLVLVIRMTAMTISKRLVDLGSGLAGQGLITSGMELIQPMIRPIVDMDEQLAFVDMDEQLA